MSKYKRAGKKLRVANKICPAISKHQLLDIQSCPLPLVQLAWPIRIWSICCASMHTVRGRIRGGGQYWHGNPPTPLLLMWQGDTVGESCYGQYCINTCP